LEIEAIFLDLGNTLRILVKDEAHQAQAREKIVKLLGSQEAPEEFCEKLDIRYKAYRKWAFENLREAPEAELWTRWLAPGLPADKVAPLAVELTYHYRQSMGRRIVHSDGERVLCELFQRGYTLGIISNVITSREIPDWLASDGLDKYFKSIVLSSVYGRRKPDPAIYWEAARLAGIPPAHCGYVGDNLKRDVTGTRQAGFGMFILLLDPHDSDGLEISQENKPDLILYELLKLLEIFPSCPVVKIPKEDDL
jgi:putative hydrolase of the HAD superfamily